MYLASDLQCWKKTFRLGFTGQSRNPDPQPLRTMMKSAGSTVRHEITPEIVTSELNIDAAGPGVKENDISRSRYWALAAGHAA